MIANEIALKPPTLTLTLTLTLTPHLRPNPGPDLNPNPNRVDAVADENALEPQIHTTSTLIQTLTLTHTLTVSI